MNSVRFQFKLNIALGAGLTFELVFEHTASLSQLIFYPSTLETNLPENPTGTTTTTKVGSHRTDCDITQSDIRVTANADGTSTTTKVDTSSTSSTYTKNITCTNLGQLKSSHNYYLRVKLAIAPSYTAFQEINPSINIKDQYGTVLYSIASKTIEVHKQFSTDKNFFRKYVSRYSTEADSPGIAPPYYSPKVPFNSYKTTAQEGFYDSTDFCKNACERRS